MCRENKSETFDLLQFKNKSHNPLGCQHCTLGCPHFQRAHVHVCVHVRVCMTITAEQRLIGPRHINSLKRPPAGIHIRSVPRLLEGEVPLQVPERNTAVLFSGNIQRY